MDKVFEELSAGSFFDGMTGKQLYRNLAIYKGEGLSRKSNGAIRNEPSEKAASDHLHKLGIRGIKYKTDMARNTEQEEYNYVIFSDKDVEITEQYAIKNTRLAMLASYGFMPEKSHPQYAIFKKANKNDDAITSESLFPEVDKNLKDSLGLKDIDTKEKARRMVVRGWHELTRKYVGLDPAQKDDAVLMEIFRQYQDVAKWSRERTVKLIGDVVGGMTRDERFIFSMNLILPDMLKDMKPVVKQDGEQKAAILDGSGESGLPFGYANEAAVKKDYKENWKRKAEENPKVAKALEQRAKMLGDVTNDLVKYKLLTKEAAERGDYFHHQVLVYMSFRDDPSWGLASTDVRTHQKGWQIGRKGSTADYNTEYVEAEFEMVSQALAQTKAMQTLLKIREVADIKPEVDAEVKRRNDHIYLVKAAKKVLGRVADETLPDGTYRKPGTYTAADLKLTAKETEIALESFKPFRAQFAKGFSMLNRLIDKNLVAFPPEFESLEEHLREQIEMIKEAKIMEVPLEEVLMSHSDMFPFLAYLINHHEAGSAAAALILKTVAAKKAHIAEVIGHDAVSIHTLLKEDKYKGYVILKPDSVPAFYFANSISDNAVEIMHNSQDIQAIHSIAVQKVLARGKDPIWIVKAGVKDTIENFRPMTKDSLPAVISKNALTAWKQWILMNPFKVIKYNINNMSGDMDICIAYAPELVFKKKWMWQAFKDLWSVARGTASQDLIEEMSQMSLKGIIGSGMTAMDIPELDNIQSVKALVDFFDGKSKGALSKWWHMTKSLSQLREDALRVAAYRYFSEKVANGEKVYGVSDRKQIDALRQQAAEYNADLQARVVGRYGRGNAVNPELYDDEFKEALRTLREEAPITDDDLAARLARDLLGDYGNISVAGQWMRERMIPFYSWLEINAPRYVRLMRNLNHEGGSAAGFSGAMVWKGSKLALKASFLMLMVMLWNHVIFPDEEDELQETGRDQLHVILGRRDDGSIITLRFQGALSDALSWFGMDNPWETASLALSGRKSAGDIVKEMAKAAPIKLFQGIRPEPKMLYEGLTGQSLYPDPTRPRPIRDTAEHIFRTFALDRVYNRAVLKPKVDGSWLTQLGRDIQHLVINDSDPGEQAYYTTRKYVFEWMEKQGKERPPSIPSNASNALYYYKQALKFSDFDAAERYLKKYQDLGGKMKDVATSVKRVHPLATLRVMDKYKFVSELSPEQKKTLDIALTWYKKHYIESTRNYMEYREAEAKKAAQ
jgi:hypothetical protein